MDVRKTSFIVAGAKRSGHASVHHCLSQHPHLQLLPVDKSGYFAKDSRFENGTPPHSKYETSFGPLKANRTYGEVCCDYLSHPSSIARLYHYNPELKIIVCLRNPAERAYSHWQEAVNVGVENRSFHEALSRELDANSQLDGDQSTRPSFGYLGQSKYSEHIECLQQYFDPHQLLFIKSEDLRYDTEVMLFQMLQFLSVPYTEVDCSAQNLGSYSESISSGDYCLLTSAVESDIYRTEELLGWNCSDWLQQMPAYSSQKTERRVLASHI